MTGDAPLKAPLLARAHGTVLEVGPGVGDNIKYYRREQISKLILVEPNQNMHAALREKAAASRYSEADGSLLLLSCDAAASDEKALADAGVASESIDTVVAVHVLSSIPGPQEAIEMYRRLLKSGGLLLFYEHVRSEDPGTAAWQEAYSRYCWRTLFDGCELHRATGDWIVLGGSGQAAEGSTSALQLLKKRDSPAKRTRSVVTGVPRGRWRDCEMTAPEGQQQFSCLPHVQGYAIKP